MFLRHVRLSLNSIATQNIVLYIVSGVRTSNWHCIYLSIYAFTLQDNANYYLNNVKR
jgi:hypothetical protein